MLTRNAMCTSQTLAGPFSLLLAPLNLAHASGSIFANFIHKYISARSCHSVLGQVHISIYPVNVVSVSRTLNENHKAKSLNARYRLIHN